MKLYILLPILLFVKISSLFSQTDNGYKIDNADFIYGEYHSVHSHLMQRDFPVLIFTPKNIIINKNDSLPVSYLLHGVNDSPANEEGIRKIYNPETRMQEMADMFRIIIVAPLVGNTFYLDAPMKPVIKIASFIGKELIAYVDKNFKTKKNRENRFLLGFSMGGYGAVSLLCRFPDTFSVAAQRAGVLNPATFIEDLYWDDISYELSSYLGNYFENKEHFHKNSCFNLINHIRDRKDIGIVIEVGKEDFLYKTNYAFHLRLNELGVPHIYSEQEGGHKWGSTQLQSLLTNLQYFRSTQY
jgi:S-formylglutathione hydrolase FrmB